MTASARTLRLILVLALANAGGVIGYLPLLTLLLPIRIEEIAPDARIGIVTATTVAGAVAASLANIAFGWWSDRSVARGGGRRRFVTGGLAATVLSYALIAAAQTPVAIVAAVVVFQLALNAMLGPILATIADEVPDDRKGLAGGLLALGVPMASAVSAMVVGTSLLNESGRYAAVVAAMAACIIPALLVPGVRASTADAAMPVKAALRRDLVAAWIARLLVQVAGSVLSGYLLYYFESVEPATPARDLAARLGHLMTLAFVVPLPIAILCGRLSDRIGRRKPVLLGAALLSATGLAIMAGAAGWNTAAGGFALYAIGSATFLALHATFAMQLLPSTGHRGRDLGLLNLANTAPSLLGPALTWLLASPGNFGALLLALAILTACGGAIMLAVHERR